MLSIKNNTSVGIDDAIHATNSAGGFPVLIMERLAIIGLVSVAFVKVRPNIKSFQHHVNCDRNTIANGAVAIGKNILVRITNSDAPSILADSHSSLSIPRKKFLKTNILYGIQMAQ